jgi:acyl-CoA synthetase (AMP-forming)/AMP-acid ligase II
VATLCWNHHAHLECYFGIPAAGGVMHTLNLRLSPEDIAWIACVVLKQGRQASAEELRTHLTGAFAKWQLPDRFEFLEAIPRTSTGKFWKVKLREMFR